MSKFLNEVEPTNEVRLKHATVYVAILQAENGCYTAIRIDEMAPELAPEAIRSAAQRAPLYRSADAVAHSCAKWYGVLEEDAAMTKTVRALMREDEVQFAVYAGSEEHVNG